MRGGPWLGAICLFAVLVVGCGGGTATTEKQPFFAEPTSLHLTYDGVARPQIAGVLMAEDKGYFRDAGLEVTGFKPSIPTRPIRYVVEGVDDIGISQQPQVVLAAEKGAPIVAIGSLVSQPTMAMIWLRGEGLHGVADLKEKTIAIPGLPFQEQFLQAVLARAGLTLEDVKLRKVGYAAVSALAKGHVDAIFGVDWNQEGAQLEAQGLDPVITRGQALGLPPYDELVVIARSDLVAEDPRPFRAFMSAVARGTTAAVEDPKATVEAIEGSVTAAPESGRKEVEAEARATLPILSRDGYMDPTQTRGLIAWMQEEGMVQGSPPASELFDNDLLKPPS